MAREWRETGPHLTKGATRGLDRPIAELAGRQHGVVSLAQLLALGLSADAVRQRVRAGRLHRVYRGVYAVGHAHLLPRARWKAATLSAGPGAALSHRSAAALHDLMPSPSGPVEVSVVTSAGRRRRDLVIHRVIGLEIVEVDHIPTTTVRRTITDLAATLPRDRLERLLERAEQLKITNVRPIPNARGAATLRSLLPEQPGSRSELERRVLRLCAGHDIPTPQINVALHLPDHTTIIVDFLWPDIRLVLEADGRAAHDTGRAFERDRRRDQLVALAGYIPLRTTWRQVRDRPGELVGLLRQYSAEASLRR